MDSAQLDGSQPASAQRFSLKDAPRWATASGSWLLAALNLQIARPVLLPLPRLPFLEPLFYGWVSIPIYVFNLLVWCLIAGFALGRWRRRAWPILIGAPLAFAVLINGAYFTWLCIVQAACI